MLLKLNCYQLKIDNYNHNVFYVGFMVTTQKLHTEDTQKKKIKVSNITTKSIKHKDRQEEKKNAKTYNTTENN